MGAGGGRREEGAGGGAARPLLEGKALPGSQPPRAPLPGWAGPSGSAGASRSLAQCGGDRDRCARRPRNGAGRDPGSEALPGPPPTCRCRPPRGVETQEYGGLRLPLSPPARERGLGSGAPRDSAPPARARPSRLRLPDGAEALAEPRPLCTLPGTVSKRPLGEKVSRVTSDPSSVGEIRYTRSWGTTGEEKSLSQVGVGGD